MRFAVIGAGGLGGYFGAKLALAGHDVGFVVRGATLAALQRDGLKVVGVEEMTVPQVTAAQDAAEIGPVDAVILAVKTNHLDGVLPLLPALVGPDTAILTMQNGVDTPQLVGAAAGVEHVLPCIVRIFTKIEEPGVIRHMGGPGTVAFAEHDGTTGPRVQALRRVFGDAGVVVEEPGDIWVELWEKALYVAPLGALGAVADTTIGVLRTTLRHTLTATVAEAAACGRATGVPLADDVVDRIMAFTDTVPADSTTSMHRDLAEGRPSELDGQIGAVVRLGRQHGVPTPRHDLLYDVLSLREAAARR